MGGAVKKATTTNNARFPMEGKRHGERRARGLNYEEKYYTGLIDVLLGTSSLVSDRFNLTLESFIRDGLTQTLIRIGEIKTSTSRCHQILPLTHQ